MFNYCINVPHCILCKKYWAWFYWNSGWKLDFSVMTLQNQNEYHWMFLLGPWCCEKRLCWKETVKSASFVKSKSIEIIIHRIYIKKVRKFPNYSVDLQQDKKSLRMAMDKAFHELRERRLDAWGQERSASV